MLVAISITLVMMATVVGVFATVSSSVSKRRAAVEVGNQLRHVRNVLQRDLEGMTCPGIPWQKPESDVGYFEIVEGVHADFYPSLLTDGVLPATVENPEIDHAVSTVPSSNLPFANAGWVTDGGGLGDHDDILAFTSRNEKDPFTGPAPSNSVDPNNNQPRTFDNWRSQTITSPVAEVIWYCLENPADAHDPQNFFGEPGMRTIYRRALLVAPWLDYKFNVDGTAKSRPGVLRIMTSLDEPVDDEPKALAALIAFQERYDISARTEFDPTIGNQGAWTIVANTLADLTDRKNRYEHHGYVGDATNGARLFPYTMFSAGKAGLPGGGGVSFVFDPDLGANNPVAAAVDIIGPGRRSQIVQGFRVQNPGDGNLVRPFVCLQGGAMARAVVNEAGQVVFVTKGLVPLGLAGPNQSRRGADLMMSDVLAFDVQVYDPDAPVYALLPDGQPLIEDAPEVGNAQIDLTAVAPDSIGWAHAWRNLTPEQQSNLLDNDGSYEGAVVSRGAYVDLGYRELHRGFIGLRGPAPSFTTPNTPFAGLPHTKSKLDDLGLTRTYDTWNFAYENDGVDQDGQYGPDQGTDNFDTQAWYDTNGNGNVDANEVSTLFGPDDVGERETSPPYPVPLRAVQVKLRVYEPDSRQIREVTVRQHFVPE